MSKSKRLKKIKEKQNELIQTGLYANGVRKHSSKIAGINLDGTLKMVTPTTRHSAERLAKKDAKKFL